MIHYYDVVDSWEFYDLQTDPLEMNNLYSDSDYAREIKELKTKLSELQVRYRDSAE